MEHFLESHKNYSNWHLVIQCFCWSTARQIKTEGIKREDVQKNIQDVCQNSYVSKLKILIIKFKIHKVYKAYNLITKRK